MSKCRDENGEPVTDADGNALKVNTLTVDLPVYASFMDQDLFDAQIGTPRLTLEGGIVPEVGNALVFGTDLPSKAM